MKLFDLRRGKEAANTFITNSESVRDVQFSPSQHHQFAAVQETGSVEIWDLRRNERAEGSFIAHHGPVFACDWHPSGEKKKWLATAGRDKAIKLWDLSNGANKPQLLNCIQTIASVAKIKWRPQRDDYIASCSLVVDSSVYVWDIHRPWVPYAVIMEHKDVSTGFAWRNDPEVLLSTSKDGTLYQHVLKNAYRPKNHYNKYGLALNARGDIAYAAIDNVSNASNKELIKSHSLGPNSTIGTAGIINPSTVTTAANAFLSYATINAARFTSIFRKPQDLSEQFTHSLSSLMKVFNLQSPSPCNERPETPQDALAKALSMDWFVKTAQSYQLSNASFNELCRINAEVASRLCRPQVAQTWRILDQMYFIPRTGTLSGNAMTAANMEFNNRNEASSRHTSGSTSRHISGNERLTLSVNEISLINNTDDESDSSTTIENNLTLQTRTTNSPYTPKMSQQVYFFFNDGDTSIATLEPEFPLPTTKVNNSELEDWDLPTEAFPLRHPIRDYCSYHLDPSDPNYDITSITSTEEDDDTSDNLSSSNVHSLADNILSAKTPLSASWNFSEIVSEMLQYYATNGDVQTTVSMLTILRKLLRSDKGEKFPKLSIDEGTQEFWYNSYLGKPFYLLLENFFSHVCMGNC